jgi:hypothetical protein
MILGTCTACPKGTHNNIEKYHGHGIAMWIPGQPEAGLYYLVGYIAVRCLDDGDLKIQDWGTSERTDVYKVILIVTTTLTNLLELLLRMVTYILSYLISCHLGCIPVLVKQRSMRRGYMMSMSMIKMFTHSHDRKSQQATLSLSAEHQCLEQAKEGEKWFYTLWWGTGSELCPWSRQADCPRLTQHGQIMFVDI